MERLQTAIEKAHRQAVHLTPQILQDHSDHDIAARWRGLSPIDLPLNLLRRNRIYAIEAGHEAISFDILRTRTLRYMQQRGWTRLAITSPTPACGKSTLSLNLAFAVAREANTRAIQIELDMRQPSQEKALGIHRGPHGINLSGFFSGVLPFHEVAWRHGERLAGVTNSECLENASDLLLGAKVGDVLQQVQDSYRPDIMIFDMPPMLINDDTLAFTRHVDCVLIVAAAEHSKIGQIEQCERQLADQTNILGVVLNKCRLTSQGGPSGHTYN